MTYGYSWMRAPLAGPDDPNARIATCNLNGISRYLCPTTGGDPWKCLDCRGIKTCTAGQRAMVLLDEETRAQILPIPALDGKMPEKEPEKTTPQARGWTEERKRKRAELDDARSREKCAKAVESGNTAEYMVEQLGYSKGSVKTMLARWKRRYPDLFAQGIPKTAVEPVEKPSEEDSDTISLMDFLEAYMPEPEMPKKADIPEKPKKTEKAENPNRELADLMIREAELLQTIAGLQDEIWEIRRKRKQLESKLSH